MGQSIVKQMVEGKELYLVWSSVVDAPVTYGCTLKQLKKFWKDEYGRNGLRELEQRIEMRGTKAFKTVDEVKTVNRAGKGETHLTTEQIVDYYFVRKGKGAHPVGWDLAHCLHPEKCNPDKGKDGCICSCEGCKEANE